MSLDFQVKLGESTSLLPGYKQNIYSVPFATSSKPALFEKNVVIKNPDDDAKWSNPAITLHHNVEDLLSAVLQVRLRPMRGENKPSEGGSPSIWPSAALMLAGLSHPERQEAIKNLSTQLGVDLSTEGWSYALARCTRSIGKATHHCYERGIFANQHPGHTLKPDALDALKKLEKLQRMSTDVSMDGAKGYLNFYETFGSHFVSSVAAGDSIFQVFAFDAQEFEFLQECYQNYPQDFSGGLSFAFAIFTVLRSEDGYGRCSAVGKICIASEDEEMAKSLKAGHWYEKDYSGMDSIFGPYYTNAIDLNTTFKKVVPISIELSSLSIFAEYYRMLIWHRIFKGAMYAKYANGSGVATYFSNNCPYDLDTAFKDSDPVGGNGLLSTLCTPSVEITQEKVDLSAIVVRFPEAVKKFAVFANAIQIPDSNSQDTTTIDIPGTCKVSLLGYVITSGGIGSLPPNIRLTDSAFNEIKDRFFCGEFHGALRISNSDCSKSYVVTNGLMLEYTDGHVSVVRDVRESPSSTVVNERIVDIQFSLVAADARLQYLLTNTAKQEKSIELMRNFLLWLGDVAGRKDEMASLQARAMYLAQVAASPQPAGVSVPLLRYEAHKDVVKNVQNVIKTASDNLTNFQKQIRDRMAEEREVDREESLNENIIKSGKLLQEYIATQASYQESMQDMFQTVFDGKEEQMDKIVHQTKKLELSLKDQRIIVDKAIAAYKEAVVDWERKEKIKAAIEIASAIFSLGSALVTPSSSFEALKCLSKTVKKIQKLITVFDAVIQVYQACKELPENPSQVVEALKDVGPEGLCTPSAFEWDEMDVQFETVLSTGPELDEKIKLSAAFQILVLRGKALLESQNAIQIIAADLAGVEQQMRLHKEHKKRLDELKIQLDTEPEKLDKEKIDLIGLSGQLLFFQRQMLMTMASTVLMQDKALQYEYLRQPTPVGSFTMMSLQMAILKQSHSINNGSTVQPTPRSYEYPITYEIHGVTPESIINNRRYTFIINTNKREFAPFNYVRVEKVAVEVDGVVSTNSGKYYTKLEFDGDPFFDRGFDGEKLTFRTTPRIFTGHQYVNSSSHYDDQIVAEWSCASEAMTGLDPFDAKISNITPFSKWHISLPQGVTNEGIKLANRINVRLIFHIYAQLNEETRITQSFRYLAHPRHISTAPRPSNSLDHPLATSFSANISKEHVLQMMAHKSKSVCDNWDVVFSITEDKLNKLLEAQFQDNQGNPKFLRETGIQEDHGAIFEFKFNAPKLEFLHNNNNRAKITLPIIFGTLDFEGKHHEVTEIDNAALEGLVDLGMVAGTVSTQHNVVVKLEGGSFALSGITSNIPDFLLAAILTYYFKNLPPGYEAYTFGTLDFKKNSVLDALKPTNFKLGVYCSDSDRYILQLFIATTGQVQNTTDLDLSEPIPSGYDCSLIVNTKIFFQDVLPESIGKATSNLALEAVDPDSEYDKENIWSSKVTACTVSCSFQETMVDSDTETINGETNFTEGYVKVPGDEVVANITGMTFRNGDASSDWKVKVKYDKHTEDHPFQYGTRFKTNSLFSHGEWSPITYHDHSVPVSLEMNSNLPLVVTGSGQNQMVSFAATKSHIDLISIISQNAGLCKCPDGDFQSAFDDKLQKNMKPQLVNIFNQQFESVSIFALKNLLFPTKNLVDMKTAFVPGDMVVFGNLTVDDTQK